MSSATEEHYEIAANYIRYLVESVDVDLLHEFVSDSLGGATYEADTERVFSIMFDMAYHLT